jgi:hypothetical protein
MKDRMNMERFLNQQNIKRYQKLLSLVSDETHRRQILSMLKEEELVSEDLSTRPATGDRINVASSSRSQHNNRRDRR